MKQWTGSKLGKECFKAVYCHPTSCGMPGWVTHKLESRLLGEILTISNNADDTTLMAESEEELKSRLMKVREKSEKAG